MSEVLHAVRIKGVASEDALAIATGLDPAAVEAALGELEAEQLIVRRPSKKRPGWVVTETGRERHAVWLAEAHGADELGRLDEPYAGFLAVNNDVKGLAARWQGASGDAERFELIEAIEDAHAKAVPPLAAPRGWSSATGATATGSGWRWSGSTPIRPTSSARASTATTRSGSSATRTSCSP